MPVRGSYDARTGAVNYAPKDGAETDHSTGAAPNPAFDRDAGRKRSLEGLMKVAEILAEVRGERR